MAENSQAAPVPIKVLVVDDSAVVRDPLLQALQQSGDIAVTGWAADAATTLEIVGAQRPDVVLLNAELARLDTLQLLRRLMRHRPLPVVISTALSARAADLTLGALEQGAVDFVLRPRPEIAHAAETYASEVVRKLKVAAGARVRPMGAPAPLRGRAPEATQVGSGNDTGIVQYRSTDHLIAIGAGIGGAAAVREILCRLPAEAPAMVISLPLPKVFSTAFAQRMNGSSPMTVHEARDGQSIQMGHIYLAPGDQHLLVVRDGARYRCRLSDADPVNHQRPSVDVLFHSVAQSVGANAIGVILSGAGSDGVMGLKALRDTGAATLAQDERSSVVWGMPGAAVQAGAAGQILPLEQIPAALQQLVAQRREGVAVRA